MDFEVKITYYTKLHSMPGKLVFGRDMILNYTFKAEWEAFSLYNQKIMNKNNQFESKKLKQDIYRIRDIVLVCN